VAASEPTSVGRQGLELEDTWQRRSPPQLECEVRSSKTRGSAWMHALLLVLTLSLYAGVPALQGTDSGPWTHLRRGCEPAGGANSSAPRSVILSFLYVS
jgi:hypothetical protein